MNIDSWVTRHRNGLRQSVCVVQALAGFVLLVFAWHTGWEHFVLLIDGVRTQGKIISYKDEHFGTRNIGNGIRNINTTFLPVVEFQEGERVVNFTDWMGSGSAGGINDTVTVIYHPANPSMAMIDRTVWNWVPWTPFFVVGSFLIIVGFRGLYVFRADQG